MADIDDHSTKSVPWSIKSNTLKGPSTTAILAVNYNTKHLIAQLIWSIYNSLGKNGFAKLLVIDNGSVDGSKELLQVLHHNNLIELIENEQNLYHGPALNQGFDYLATIRGHKTEDVINAVWVLDSDCVVLRNDVLKDSTSLMNQSKAAILGQPLADTWHAGDFGLHSLLIDPEQVWQKQITSFEEHGEPSKHIQESCKSANLVLQTFNFTRDGYVVHLGRSTLAQIVKMNDHDNIYHDWALTHTEPHYAGEANGVKLYREFKTNFDAQVKEIVPSKFAGLLQDMA